MKDDYNYTETAYSREMEGQNEKYPPDTSDPPDEPEDIALAAAPGVPTVEGPAAMGADGPTVIDTPEGIRMFHLLQLKYCMKLQMQTGLRHSQGSVFNLVKKKFGLRGNHEKVYKAFCKQHSLEE
jgi:hypothetical protein